MDPQVENPNIVSAFLELEKDKEQLYNSYITNDTLGDEKDEEEHHNFLLFLVYIRFTGYPLP